MIELLLMGMAGTVALLLLAFFWKRLKHRDLKAKKKLAEERLASNLKRRAKLEQECDELESQIEQYDQALQEAEKK